MPLKRRRVTTARTARKSTRKPYGRRKIKRVRGKFVSGYSFTRWITGITAGNTNVRNCTYDPSTSVITATAANSDVGFSTFFILGDLPNVTEFQNLFDQYMVTGIIFQIKMIQNPDASWKQNESAGTANAANFFPTIWYVNDYDDNATLSLAQIKEHQGVRHRVLKPNTEIVTMVRPTTLTQLFRTTLTTGYNTNKRNQWVDMGQTDVPHYGIKMVIDFEGLSPSVAYTFKVNCKYMIKCKGVR